MSSSPVKNSVKSFLQSLPPLKNTKVNIAVSGGPDSMVLLRVLLQFRAEFQYRPRILHYDYRYHDRSDSARALVKDNAEENSIPFVEATVNSPEELDQQHGGYEARARELRYNFFQSVLSNQEDGYLFLAHHRDDQVETVLLNIGRGTGLSGLGGMTSKSRRNGMTLCRPLLSVPAESIMEFAHQNDISYVDDPTNKDTDYARNSIRHEILPLWRDIQPDPDEAIHKLAERARRENGFWHEFVREEFEHRYWENEVQTDRDVFKQFHPAAQLRCLRMLVVELLGNVNGWSEVNFQDLLDLFVGGRSGARISLPGPTRAIVERSRGCLYRTDESPVDPANFDLEANEKVMIDNLGELIVEDSKNSYRDAGSATFLGVIDGSIDDYHLRTWKPGDRFQEGQQRKKIKELFDDNSVPYRARRLWPLLVKNDLVRCVPGLLNECEEGNYSYRIGFHPEHPTFDQLLNSEFDGSKGRGSKSEF